MSWFDACKKYKEMTGHWIVPKVGTKEHGKIQEIYHSLKYQNKPIALEAVPIPTPEHKVESCLKPEKSTVAMIPIARVEQQTSITQEEYVCLCQQKEAELAQKRAEIAQKEREIKERMEQDMLESLRRKQLVNQLRQMAPKTSSTKKRDKRTGKFIMGVMSAKVLSFD